MVEEKKTTKKTAAILGSIIGGIQGYFGGPIDLLGQRAIEIWGAIPRLMLLMILSDFLSRQADFSGGAYWTCKSN